MHTKIKAFGAAAVLAAITVIGCSQQSRDDYNADASKVGSTMKSDASKAENSMSKSLDTTKKALSNDETSATVKQALMSAKDLTTKDLKVDTNGKTVLLHGTVPTADQKKRADVIAKGVLGPDYKVDDKLMVNPY